MTEETKSIIKSIYRLPVIDEINNRDANELLVRSTGIPIGTAVAAIQNSSMQTPNNTFDGSK